MSLLTESICVPPASSDKVGRHLHNALCDKMRLMVKWIEMPVTAKIGGCYVTNLRIRVRLTGFRCAVL